MTLAELMMMVRGRRRDEWDRFASLMSLVWDRTNFEDKPKPSKVTDFIPVSLLDDDDTTQIAETQKPLEPISIRDLIAMSGAR